MSKASEWVRIKPQPFVGTRVQAWVDPDGQACIQTNGNMIDAKESRALAHWLLDTFGEESA